MRDILSNISYFTDDMQRFDLVDRLIVSFYMFTTVMLLVFVLSQQLTTSEMQEIAPAVQVFAHLPFFFLAWPVVFLILSKLARMIYNKVSNGVETT